VSQHVAPPGAAARAVERVLQAEHDAQERLEQVRQRAHAQLEQARDDALAIVNRSMERVAHWQHAHAAALDRRLQSERDQAAAATRAQHAPDAPAVAAAVARVARRLIDAPDDRLP
jgi:vacuolar-type H+-ATPase subunit H